MKLSVVIPTRNRASQLCSVVAALSAQAAAADLDGAVEIIVVDDGSTERQRQRISDCLREAPPDGVRCILLDGHRGASAARNAGVRHSRGEIVAFVDDDLVVGEGYLTETIRCHEAHPEALVINGNLLKWRDDVYSDYWFSRYERVFNRPGSDFYSVNGLASGHFSLKRKLLAHLCRLFDEQLPSREDFDLYLRLRGQGIAVYKSDTITAYNRCRRSLWGLMRQYAWYARGEYLLRRKHGMTRVVEEESTAAAAESEAPSEPARFLIIRHAIRLSGIVALNYETYRHEKDPRCLLRIADAVLFAGALRWAYRRLRGAAPG